MAVSTSSYFSNSIVGVPQLGADIGVFDTHLSPKYAVGFGFQRADGSKYRYVHFGAATNRGLLCATDISESCCTYQSLCTVSLTTTKLAGETISPNAIDSRYIQALITATADQFAGGTAVVTNTGSGTGYSYRIKGNTATGDPTTGYCYLELYDKLVTALDTTTDLSIAGSRYSNCEGATTTDKILAGATMTSHSSGSYGWVCTKGPACVLTGVTITVIGNHVALSTDTTGACMGVPATSSGGVYAFTQTVGTCLVAGSNSEYSLVDMSLE
jgi:hypothetical protein